ncbi:MAG: sialate O-acetylesterase [Rhodothermales bacterium]
MKSTVRLVTLRKVSERYPALNDVRDAQFRAAEVMRNVVLVDTDNLTKLPDNLHYDTGGVMEMGSLFATAYLDWRKENHR